MEVFEVDAKDTWASLNFISASGLNVFTVSVDEHPMWVYAVDGRHITPVKVDALVIANGERYSVMIKLEQKPADYTIRYSNPGINQILFGYSILRYKDGDKSYKSTASITKVGTNTTAEVVFLDSPHVKPFPPVAPSKTANATYHLLINRFGASWKWTLSGKQDYDMSLEDDQPLLFNPYSSAALNRNLTITTKYGDWVDLIIQVQFPPLQPPHALHKHSNKGFIIGEGVGDFKWETVADAMKDIPDAFNLVDPPLRDGYLTIPTTTGPTWLVIRYKVENPGAFLFHCRKSLLFPSRARLTKYRHSTTFGWWYGHGYHRCY